MTMVAALAACGGGADANADGTVEWDYFVFVPATHPSGIAAQDFADAVAEATDGEVQITVRAAGELPLEAPEALQAIRSGEVEVADAYAGFIAGDVSTAGLLGLPFLATSNEESVTAVDALMEDIDTQFAEYGAELLFTYDWSMQVIAGTGTPVTAPEDMAGRKARASSPEQSAWLESTGAFPTTLATAEVPTGLSTGVIDSVLTSPLNITGSGWGDLLDWVYTLGVNPGLSFIVVNEEALSEVSEDGQAAIREVADEFNTSISARMAEQNEASAAELADNGVEFNEPTADQIAQLRSDVRPMWDAWAADHEAQELLDKVTAALGL